MLERALGDSDLPDSIDNHTQLAGSNCMEILLFSLGTAEHFGINVFKVREVSKTPFITRTPNMPTGVEGLISLRGNVIPVLSLASILGIAPPGTHKEGAMMVTEYSKRTLGFLVQEVDRIIRVDWEKVRTPRTWPVAATPTSAPSPSSAMVVWCRSSTSRAFWPTPSARP